MRPSSPTLPRKLNVLKSILTRSGKRIDSVSSDELKVTIVVPSLGGAASDITERMEPAPGKFCTMTTGEPAR